MQRLMMEVPSAVISEISVSPFSTEETGFWIAQLALAKHPDGMIVYSNTAPRKDKLEGREKNAGEGLVYAKLKNGVEVVAVNSGYSMSMSSLLGLLLNTAIMYILVSGLHFYVFLSQIMAGLMVACVTFFISRRVFRQPEN
jgi:hypothetical protein